MENIDLSAFCKTKSQANDFITSVTKIAEKIYETDFSVEKSALEHLGLQKKELFMKLLREHNIDAGAVDSLKDFLTKLADTAGALPQVSLTIAFEPTEQTLAALSEWFLLNTKKQMLFDITVDRSLIGGAIINSNGKHANFTIKDTFEKILHDVITQKDTPSAPLETKQGIEHFHLGR